MKIVQVIPHYVPAYRFGGPLKVAHSLGKSFVGMGHDVTVCTTSMASDDTDLDVPLGEPVKLDGVTVFYEPVSFFRYWGFSLPLLRRIRKEIGRADLVLIHAHYQFANWIGARTARKLHKPYVIFSHSSLHKKSVNHKRSIFKKLYLRIMEHTNLSKALFIAFNAKEEKDFSFYKELGRIVPNGIDPTEFADIPAPGFFIKKYPELKGKTVFLFLGRLDVKHKGLDLLITSFAKFVGIHQEVHLVLAGPDEDNGLNQIKKLARLHAIEDKILLPGLISGQEKLAALQDADVFVLPSRFEGLSIALLEALYFGIPLLVTDQIGLHEEVDRIGAGVVVAAESEESIYQGLLQLNNKKTRDAMRRRGTEFILQEHNWDVIASNLVVKIQEIEVVMPS